MADTILRLPRRLRFGPFEVDIRAGELRKRGVRLRLPEQPFRILVLLLESPGDVVTRVDIRLRLWPNQTVVEFDHGINAAVRKLREVLGDTAEKPRYVETVARRGYRFIGQIEQVEESSHSGGSGETVNSPPIATGSQAIETGIEGKYISHYLVFDNLGSGGMGIVHRAKDLNLNRKVALKFLPDEYSRDHEPLERFRQEARTAAALNHPNICTIYEVGEHENRPFIAMELLEGQTLRDVLREGPLPLSKLLEVGIQIAEGLEAAHQCRVVHRDIKAANIFVTWGGQAKILDFGLAELSPGSPSLSGARSGAAEAQAEKTLGRGVLVGTLSYMSPEQVRGQEPDPRSDIFSLGVLLYEMASGKRPFEKNASLETLNSILTEEPPDLPLSAITPVDEVVRRCLQKQAALRFQSAAEVATALRAVQSTVASKQSSITATSQPVLRLWPLRAAWRTWLAVVILLIALIAARALVWFERTPVKLTAVQFSIYPPPGIKFESLRYGGPPLISPDGSTLAFCSRDGGGVRRIWIRRLDSLVAQPLRSTETGSYPFWSPDGRYIGFFADGMLKKVPLDGGPAATIVPAMAYGAAWTQKDGGPGTILYTPANNPGLALIPANGGTPIPVTVIGPGPEEIHRHPLFLPDGRHFIYLKEHVEDDAADVFAGDIQARADFNNLHKVMSGAQGMVWWAPPGYLLYLRDNNLMAQQFDARQLQLKGEAFLVEEHVGNGSNRWTSDFSVSLTGVLAWRGDFNARRQLVWLDRSGRRADNFEVQGPYWSPRLSPDGRRIAMIGPEAAVLGGISDAAPPRANHLWIWDPEEPGPSPLTLEQAMEAGPVWSPSGDRIAFGRCQGESCGIFVADARRNGNPELLVRTDQFLAPSSWSPDGSMLLLSKNRYLPGVWALAAHDGSKPVLISTHDANYQVSPDGHWAAYMDASTGHMEVHVRAFDERDPTAKSQIFRVSSEIGYFQRWRRDGKELFYYDGHNILAVPVETGRAFQAGTPVRLFDAQDFDGQHVSYDVSPDGSRFLVSRLWEDVDRPMNITLDWLAATKNKK